MPNKPGLFHDQEGYVAFDRCPVCRGDDAMLGISSFIGMFYRTDMIFWKKKQPVGKNGIWLLFIIN